MARRFEMTDAEWERVAPLLPGKQGDPGRTARDNRLFVDAALWVLRTGASWRDLPERYGNPGTARKRFSRWCARGVWGRVLAALGPDPDLEAVLLDSTIVRAHPHAAGGKGGRRRKASAGPAAGSGPSSISRPTGSVGR
jgi:putative transposase